MQVPDRQERNSSTRSDAGVPPRRSRVFGPDGAAWIQAIAASLALMFAAPALLISMQTLRDQQEISKSQAAVNQLELDREQRRYASRVAWWTRSGTPSLEGIRTGEALIVQNRSTVPVLKVSVTGRLAYAPDAMETIDGIGQDPSPGSKPLLPDSATLPLPDLPPCSILSTAIPTSTYWTFGSVDFKVRFVPDYLSFAEGSRSWRKTSSLLIPVAPFDQPASEPTPDPEALKGMDPEDRARALLRHRIFRVSVEENPASDCSGDA
jgi:hypothetical protein